MYNRHYEYVNLDDNDIYQGNKCGMNMCKMFGSFIRSELQHQLHFFFLITLGTVYIAFQKQMIKNPKLKLH